MRGRAEEAARPGGAGGGRCLPQWGGLTGEKHGALPVRKRVGHSQEEGKRPGVGVREWGTGGSLRLQTPEHGEGTGGRQVDPGPTDSDRAFPVQSEALGEIASPAVSGRAPGWPLQKALSGRGDACCQGTETGR